MEGTHMTDGLTAEAMQEFPRIFKLAAERVRGGQHLSVERAPEGIVVEVLTNVNGAEFRVLTSSSSQALSSPRSTSRSESVQLYIDGRLEGVRSWERTPSDGSWQVTLDPADGLLVQVLTSEGDPPAELRLVGTTVLEELPASFRP